MSVYVGLYTCTCRILGATSLKEKRQVLQSVQSRIRNQSNLSVAEVDDQDRWQLTELAFACVGSHQRVIDQELQKASRLLEARHELEILDAHITYL